VADAQADKPVVAAGRHALSQLSGGLMSNHLVNWLTPTKERLTIVTGEKGMFIADTLTADLTFYANGRIATTWDDIAQFRGVSEGDVTRFAIAKPEPLRTEHENFRDAILGRDGTLQVGNTVDILDNERLEQLYGVGLRLLDVPDWPRRVCAVAQL